jgi:hypothetical protein
MTITEAGLTKGAAICAAVGGAIYCVVQIKHPAAAVANLATTNVEAREIAKVVFTVLAMAGFTGMFLANRRRFGALGLVGYVVLMVGFLALFATQCIVGFVLPTVAHGDPQYVQHVLNAAVGESPSGGIGHMQQLLLTTGIGYPFGGLLFGIALFRARLLARSACALLAIGTVSVLALAALPESYNRPFALPTGVALICLGVSLWRSQRRTISLVDAAPVNVEPVTV